MNGIRSIISFYTTSYANISKENWQHVFLYFLNTISTGFCFYISIYLANNLHLPILISSIIISAYGVGTSIGGVVGGKLCDQLSCRFVMMHCLLLKSVAFLCLLFFKTPIALIPIVLILGFTNYGFITANNTYVLRQCCHSESERLKLINVFFTASNLGLGISVVMMTALTNYLHELFIFSAALLTTIAICYLHQPDDNHATICRDTQKTRLDSNDPNTMYSAVFLLTLACIFLLGLIIAQWRITFVAYLHTVYTHLSTHSIGWILALNPAIIVFFQSILVNHLKNQNNIVIMGLGGFLIGFGMFILVFGTSLWVAISACIIYTVGEMIFFSMAQLLCYKHSPAHQKGQAMGWFKSFYAMSTIVGPMLGGFVYHHMAPNIIWYASGAIGSLTVLACLILYRIIASHQFRYTLAQRGHPMQM